jgi:hypothetical protein
MWGTRALAVLPLLVACTTEPPDGSQIGAIRQPDPDPAPPSDLTDIDMRASIEAALALAGIVTTQSAFVGHLDTMAMGEVGCPDVWAGAPPENFVELELDEDATGLSWLAGCSTRAGVEFDGFAFWTSEIDQGENTATRSLLADAEVRRGADVLWAFDGEASDTFDAGTGMYSSSFAGTITGSMSGLGKGLRAGNNTESDNGGFIAEWGTDGSLHFAGSVQSFDGFGPVDRRSGDEPELEGIAGWKPNQPRFTSVRYDLTFGPDCAEEPLGFVGLRGNEGFWFDVFFLPIYAIDEDTADSNAFPFENIENQSCDGIGTLFSRNVNLGEIDAQDTSWSRELAPDFDSARNGLPTPDLESYIYSLRHLPQE